MIGEFLFIGLVAGLLGLFYRNCLKGKDMILNPIYVVLSRWVDNARFCMEWPKEASEEGYNLKWCPSLDGLHILWDTVFIAVLHG